MDRLSQSEKLLEWRRTVRACRKCTFLPDGRPIDVNDDNQLRQAGIHYEKRERIGKTNGWAMAMLDKKQEADCKLEILSESCRSGVIALLEAPNDGDTYSIFKGYLTYDNETDETGKFTRKILKHIGLSVNNVVFTNAVQCLPVKKGAKYSITNYQQENCKKYLYSLVKIIRPKVILAFGNEALKALHRFEPFVLSGDVLRSSEINVHSLVGHVFSGWWSTNVIPLFHPGPRVRSCAKLKSGLPGTGRSESDQFRDIEIARRFL